jgi:trans-2,3-dihydro-3-hydroxyanthranilate isomerase
MPRELTYSIVDVFTNERFGGNPAAVVFDPGPLEDEQMAALAREFNLSETTFVLPSTTPEAAVRFRWFTPTTEVQMCGHATLAGVHALVESGRFVSLRSDPQALLPIQTASATLIARMETMPETPGRWLTWLDLAPPRLEPVTLNIDKVIGLLGGGPGALMRGLPVVRTQDGDLILFVEDFVQLQALRPDHGPLGRYCAKHRIRGVCVATLKTLAPSVQVQSRFFAPAAGVHEDPVTGSVHGPLAAYLVENDLLALSGGSAAVSCVQSEAGGRAGLVRAMVTRRSGARLAVRIGGQCVTSMVGRLFI